MGWLIVLSVVGFLVWYVVFLNRESVEERGGQPRESQPRANQARAEQARLDEARASLQEMIDNKLREQRENPPRESLDEFAERIIDELLTYYRSGRLCPPNGETIIEIAMQPLVQAHRIVLDCGDVLERTERDFEAWKDDPNRCLPGPHYRRESSLPHKKELILKSIELLLCMARDASALKWISVILYDVVTNIVWLNLNGTLLNSYACIGQFLPDRMFFQINDNNRSKLRDLPQLLEDENRKAEERFAKLGRTLDALPPPVTGKDLGEIKSHL